MHWCRCPRGGRAAISHCTGEEMLRPAAQLVVGPGTRASCSGLLRLTFPSPEHSSHAAAHSTTSRPGCPAAPSQQDRPWGYAVTSSRAAVESPCFCLTKLWCLSAAWTRWARRVETATASQLPSVSAPPVSSLSVAIAVAAVAVIGDAAQSQSVAASPVSSVQRRDHDAFTLVPLWRAAIAH